MTLKLEPGMRVRCVVAEPWVGLVEGCDYRVDGTHERPWTSRQIVSLAGVSGRFFADRFKPVVRVKAKSTYEGEAFDGLVERARKAFNALSPEEQRAHSAEQRESWARGELALSKLERKP